MWNTSLYTLPISQPLFAGRQPKLIERTLNPGGELQFVPVAKKSSVPEVPGCPQPPPLRRALNKVVNTQLLTDAITLANSTLGWHARNFRPYAVAIPNNPLQQLNSVIVILRHEQTNTPLQWNLADIAAERDKWMFIHAANDRPANIIERLNDYRLNPLFETPYGGSLDMWRYPA